eukprot:m.310086 g.310086  ORF g.310086 m.310086 type:complete len:164 (+) comp49447_c0_seq1:75-566(+)
MLTSVKVADEELRKSGDICRAGFVILNRVIRNGVPTLCVLMVKKANGTLPWGFPKGGIEGDETFLQTAVRELFEETGVTMEQLELFEDITFAEPNGLGKYTLYFCATFAGNSDQQKFKFCGDEIEEVEWVPVDSVTKYYSQMKPTRKSLLKMVLDCCYSGRKS